MDLQRTAERIGLFKKCQSFLCSRAVTEVIAPMIVGVGGITYYAGAFAAGLTALIYSTTRFNRFWFCGDRFLLKSGMAVGAVGLTMVGAVIGDDCYSDLHNADKAVKIASAHYAPGVQQTYGCANFKSLSYAEFGLGRHSMCAFGGEFTVKDTDCSYFSYSIYRDDVFVERRDGGCRVFQPAKFDVR